MFMKNKYIKKQYYLPLIIVFAENIVLYWLPMLFCDSFKHHDLSTVFDTAVPVLPGFIFIYVSFFVFWALNYIVIAHYSDEKSFYRFFTADLISKTICMLFFVFYPTIMERPVLVSDTFSKAVLNFIYTIDKPSNLFPSMHCLTSWLCFVGIREHKSISKSYRVFCALYAVLILASTLFVKQHLIVDVLSGVFWAEICMLVCKKTDLYTVFQKLFSIRFQKAKI